MTDQRAEDKSRGTFTAHNWEESWYLRRIHYAAEEQAIYAGRPFSWLAVAVSWRDAAP